MENLIKILTPLLPTIFLLIGGQYLLDKYLISRKKREQEVELLKAIRQQQYATITELYAIFAKYMYLYRIINADYTDLADKNTKIELHKLSADTEAKIDALILKIGCEFASESDDKTELDKMLGNLRQSVQLWRETIANGTKLPFYSSNQQDYLKFKTSFAKVSAFLINKIHEQLEPPKTVMQRVQTILLSSFDNKHEFSD